MHELQVWDEKVKDFSLRLSNLTISAADDEKVSQNLWQNYQELSQIKQLFHWHQQLLQAHNSAANHVIAHWLKKLTDKMPQIPGMITYTLATVLMAKMLALRLLGKNTRLNNESEFMAAGIRRRQVLQFFTRKKHNLDQLLQQKAHLCQHYGQSLIRQNNLNAAQSLNFPLKTPFGEVVATEQATIAHAALKNFSQLYFPRDNLS